MVILPLKIYGFCHIEEKKPKDYLVIALYSLFSIIAAVCCLSSESNISTNSIAFYILIGILYIQCIMDCYRQRTKWTYLICSVFTFFIFLLIILFVNL